MQAHHSIFVANNNLIVGTPKNLMNMINPKTPTKKYLVTALAAIATLFLVYSCNKTKDFKAVTETDGVSSNLTTTTKPNIVFILGDDVGVDIPTCYGGQSYQTPNIDMMAQLGMKFTECHSSPLCSPSRVCIMTGKYNFRNYDEWGVLDPTQSTFGNLLKSAGYATFVGGKWQLDGGDAGIHGFGFDDYSLWNAIKDGVRIGSHYKDPQVYEKGVLLPKNKTEGKYGDDIFTDRLLSFIDKNKTTPFFAYFPITLCHDPFSPTPDDPEFASWISKGNPSDTSFFPSMVKYMDKKIGIIIDKLKAVGVYNNTIIIFVGDNGTPSEIYSWVNGKLVQGGKSQTNESGTNVPLTVLWPNGIAPGQVNTNLIDFTDFLPTLGDAAGITIPLAYGQTDGQSFYNQLIGGTYTPRDWIFNHYAPNTNKGNTILLRWVQDHTYKLYDSSGVFFNIVKDPLEKKPIKSTRMSPYETLRKARFQAILDSLH